MRPFNPKRLVQVRELVGITQEEMALDFEILPMQLALWESGAEKPDLESIRKIADYFQGEFPSSFFFREDPPEFGLGSLIWH